MCPVSQQVKEPGRCTKKKYCFQKNNSQCLFQTNVAQNARVTGNLSFHQECAPFNEKSIGKNSRCKQMHAPTASVLMGRRFAREKVAQSWSVHRKIKNYKRDIAVPGAPLCHNLIHTTSNVVILDAPSRHVYHSITFTNYDFFRNMYFYSELSVIWINLIENCNSITFRVIQKNTKFKLNLFFSSYWEKILTGQLQRILNVFCNLRNFLDGLGALQKFLAAFRRLLAVFREFRPFQNDFQGFQ